MAMRFFRVIFVCAVITTFYPFKSEAQLVVNITNGVSGVLNISHSIDVKDPEDVIVQKGQSATLKCTIKTLPSVIVPQIHPVVTWLHENIQISKNDTKRTLQKDGSLFIPKVTAGRRPLTGHYRCKVKNEIGVVVSGEAKLQIASLDFDTTEETITVAEYQPVILPCQIHSVPSAKVRWDFNKTILPHDLRYVPLPLGALLIVKSLFNDTGIYRCIVTNNILKKTKIKTVKLTVLSALNEFKSVSFLPLPIPQNITITLGVRTTLYCITTGWPLPTIEWLKNDLIISNNSVLNLTSVDQQASGLYICRAKNSVNTITQNYQINVQQKPYFTLTPISKSYTSAGIVKLECTAGGYPEPCIQWFKNGEKLKLGGRIRKKDGVLIMSHTFTYDAGMYQCVASNTAGSVWTSAQVILTSPYPPPPPPIDVKCRSYDERNICITWKSPKNLNASAFSIFSFPLTNYCLDEKCQGTNTGCDDGPQEELGPDYVTTVGDHHLANRLNPSTNYTFYVRLYSKAASDDSSKVICSTGVKGERNLKFKLLTSNTIELKWSEISSDITCGNTSTGYLIQWKRENYQMINTFYTESLKYNITGLNPSILYHFRIMSSSYRNEDTKWVALTIPDIENIKEPSYINVDDTNIAQNAPINPDHFRASKITSKSIMLNWLVPNEQPKFYLICYVEINEDNLKRCEDGDIVKSFSNMKQIDNLKPNTLYEFRIRAHNSEGFYGHFSSALEVRTHPDVPSTVLDLKYKIINETTVCLAWLPPIYTNGKLLNYIVTYTPDPNLPLEDWIHIKIFLNETSNISCWFDEETNTISLTLTNLKSTEEYTVIVRAESENGLSNPTFPFLIKTVIKNRITNKMNNQQEDIINKQKMGVFVGCILAMLCIGCCISCIVLRKRCVKQQRNLTQARLTVNSNNYYPAVARYATEGNSVQVRLENTCSADLHEIQNLVNNHEGGEVPPTRLDTKGRNNIPNGHINGLKKPIDCLLNGHVHITENPQYEKRDRKLHYAYIQEDPNSNKIPTSKHRHNFLDLSQKKRYKSSRNNSLFNGNIEDDDSYTFSNKDLDITQLTCLDDTFIVGNHRKISPLLEPNG